MPKKRKTGSQAAVLRYVGVARRQDGHILFVFFSAENSRGDIGEFNSKRFFSFEAQRGSVFAEAPLTSHVLSCGEGAPFR